MRQILQDIRNGHTILAEVPSPMDSNGSVLITTRKSLVSVGTEKMLLDFGKAGWIDKARQQPEKVIQVLAKIKTDGFAATVNTVKAKLDKPMPMGYSNVGVVLDSGSHQSLMKGDRVISNGPHAETVCAPHNLCAKIPQNVSDEQAAFTVVGAIGLQGIRLINPTLGETIVVTGLGLIGLLCVQMLRAQGCRVLGIDFDGRKCELARQFGAMAVDLSKGEDPVAAGMAYSEGRGIDGVLITASTTSNDPVHQAANMCRKRGRIILVGVTGLELSRADFYEKELSFQVSCSYGPGRYDPNYEDKGQDYPLGFVRWTEQRNFEAFLQLLADGHVNTGALISHRFDFDDALKAYEEVGSGDALGVVLNYPQSSADSTPHGDNDKSSRTIELVTDGTGKNAAVCIGYIGAGGFSGQVLLPALVRTSARLKAIVSSKGVTGTHLGQKFGFEQSSTDVDSVMADQEINTVVIATRHSSHAKFLKQALTAGKRVYVEKPLCLTPSELTGIIELYSSQKDSGNIPFVMVGFNRRFAPQVVKMKSLLSGITDPKAMIMTVNAGCIPNDHWTQDLTVGGGRIIGEGCHFIDLLRYMADSPIVSVNSSACAKLNTTGCRDTMTISLGFADGSIGSVHYFANGNKGCPKERLDIFTGGRVLQLENFRRLKGYGWKNFSKMNLWNQDKGHRAEMEELVATILAGKPCPIPFEEIVEVTRASFVAAGHLDEL